jgi:LDH2 family malate/lactate/ureidoglycolate dehydrogenase
MTGSGVQSVPAVKLTGFVAALFAAAGVPDHAAAAVAGGLVEADLCGLHSHGVMLVEMYIDRLLRGSVSASPSAAVVSDNAGAVVLDAGHALGQLTGQQAMAMAIARARQHASGIVAVRHGFHFGAAGQYAVMAAEAGCIGIAMCNTRPLMPAPGGAERLVGNNPLAIAIPSDGVIPIVLDMATSEAAMGKIRLAANAGETIPASWAVQNDGTPTTDPRQAIAGMLLPAAGAKGFGLAFMIDLMCGLLSGGASGEAVTPLYGDPGVPYDCSHLFIAIDVSHFCEVSRFRAAAAAAAERLRSGKRAFGVAALFAPGEPEWRRRQSANNQVELDSSVMATLLKLAAILKVSDAPLHALAPADRGENHYAQA